MSEPLPLFPVGPFLLPRVGKKIFFQSRSTPLRGMDDERRSSLFPFGESGYPSLGTGLRVTSIFFFPSRSTCQSRFLSKPCLTCGKVPPCYRARHFFSKTFPTDLPFFVRAAAKRVFFLPLTGGVSATKVGFFRCSTGRGPRLPLYKRHGVNCELFFLLNVRLSNCLSRRSGERLVDISFSFPTF